MNTVKVLTKGQIVIPAPIRKKYDIHPGNSLQIFEYGDLIYLVPPAKDPINDAMGCLPENPSLSETLLKERKKDFAK
ncbi:MAG TPA: AbrB/MazE/SpoVT family DNA-binding domain-containing protein [Desulfobacterales bacterium]|nr:AbrB/MazE/SpoVT family DNA-binding domain-containing protein [Desulfobacterales bacterium]